MGKKIAVVLLLFIAINHFGFTQDKVDPRPLDASLFSDTNVYDKDFHKRHFIRGWNFSGQSKKLDSALRINYYLSGWELPVLVEKGMNETNLYGHRCTYSYYYVFHNRSNPNVKYFNGHSLYLKPYITVDTSNYFEPKPDEGTGAVFGFLTKALGDTTTEVIGNDAFHTFRLNKTQVTPGNPITVLSNPWKNDLLKYLNYSGLASKDSINGKIWYLTLNLRSRDTIIPGWLMDSTILTLRVKYKTYNVQTKTTRIDSIKFWKFPTDELRYLISSRGDTLGLARDPGADSNTTEIKEWQIKAKHLVTGSGNRAGKLITLCAEFDNYGIDPLVHPNRRNPVFMPDENPWSFPNEFITNIDVVVLYHGHLDLSINYIRIETPQAQAIFRGKYDQALADTISRLNQTIRAYNTCNMRIHRFYTQDEPIPSEWATTRYVNKLLNGLGVVETGFDPGRFLYSTDFDMFWMGSTLHFDMRCPPPYIRAGILRTFSGSKLPDGFQRDQVMISCFGYQTGYKGQYNISGVYTNCSLDTFVTQFYHFDTLNSGYEFHFGDDFEKGTILKVTDAFKDYHRLYRNALFSNKPWYAFLWVTPELTFNPKFELKCNNMRIYLDTAGFSFKPGNDGKRPKTGEELRLMMWKPILLGTKGLFYFRGKHNPDDRREQTGLSTTRLDSINLIDNDLIYSDTIGGDYIDLIDTNIRMGYGLGQCFYSECYSWDTLGIDSNHIYTGWKSNRAEIMKLHRWIEAVEDTLLKLKLLAWYYYGGQGFNGKADVKEIFYSQDPKVTLDTILKNYIKVDDITTRRIDNGVYDPDSLRFFLLTLFRPEEDTTMYHKTKLNEFYIGILNPRTDPLVRTFDTIRNQQGEILFIDSSMKFYSTAEYDIGVRYGNYTHIWNPSRNSYEWRDTSYWQSLWWRRQGCREIQIPLNLPTTDYLVIAKELGAEDERLNAEFWRDKRFYHRVDTTFEGKGEIAVRLLPGEGKILRISVIPNDRAKIQSNLNKSLKQDGVYINCEEMLKLDE